MNFFKKLKSNKIIIDIILNISAAALPIAMLQLIIYPRVAKDIGGDEYGLMLTIYSVWIMISNSLGNVLNNIKLLKFPEYSKAGVEGDLPILLRRWLCIGSAIIFFVIWIYCGEFSPIHIFLGVIAAAFIMLKAYFEVGFRIKLNYVAILINHALLSIGFFLGYFLCKITGIWELIFILGYALSSFYCIAKTELIKEPAVKTQFYQEVKKDSYSLVCSTVINNLINYADKLVLYPLMGGMAVSIYYTATILGKITGMLTGPINSVILSYITRWDKTKANVFFKVIIVGGIVATLGYFITLLISRPVLSLLFPQWLEEVMDIIPYTTVTIMLNVLVSIMQPFVLKYCKMQWQIAISALGSVAYFTCALILWNFMGLKGFCIGTIVGIVTKLIIMVLVYCKSVNALK